MRGMGQTKCGVRGAIGCNVSLRTPIQPHAKSAPPGRCSSCMQRSARRYNHSPKSAAGGMRAACSGLLSIHLLTSAASDVRATAARSSGLRCAVRWGIMHPSWCISAGVRSPANSRAACDLSLHHYASAAASCSRPPGPVAAPLQVHLTPRPFFPLPFALGRAPPAASTRSARTAVGLTLYVSPLSRRTE